MQEALGETLTIDEASSALSVGRSTVAKLNAAGDLESRKIGSARRLSVADLERYVDGLGNQG